MTPGGEVFFLSNRSPPNNNFAWVRHYTRLAYALFGLMAGLMSGTVNVMVPILVILTLELQLAMQAALKLFNLDFLTGKLTQASVFFAGGHIEAGFMLQTLWLVPLALLGLAVGLRIRCHISEVRYKRVLRGCSG